MTAIPKLPGIDHTIPLLREGYDFLPVRFERLDSDILQARLRLERVICMRGREAGELFYDSARFRRRGATPRRVQKTLLGRGGVQTLDGQAHRRRKALFMTLMTEPSIDRLVGLFESHWRAAMEQWQAVGTVQLLAGAREVLCRAVCDWAGVPLPADDVTHRARQLERLFDAGAAVGPRHWKGRIARKRANAWIADVVDGVRHMRVEVPDGSATHRVAWHREDGELLESRVAAVELLNLLRPTVAIDRYIVFAALALHEHEAVIDRLEPAWDPEDHGDRVAFVHEVRRYYPFFPFVGARVRADFEWRGHHFEEGRLTLLDLYGTNHDPRLWDDPDTFRPGRFRDANIGPYSLVPQGGGDHYTDHRCAGEWITIAITAAAVRLLTREMRYRVPEQDLTVDHGRIPARPASGLVLELTNGAGRSGRGRGR